MKAAMEEMLDVDRGMASEVDDRERASMLTQPADAGADGSPLFARSPAMRELAGVLARAAQSSQVVCLIGETGTGREVIAREIHRLSGGAAERFTVIDCADRQTADLDARIASLVAGPARTMVYLAHLASMPLDNQARLVRVIRSSQSVGGAPGVRFGASLDLAVSAAVEDGHLLQELADLMLPIEVPALRQRKLDVPLLAEHLLHRGAQAHGTAARTFSRAAASLLSALPWPGNTPELERLVGQLAASVNRPVVELDDVLVHLRLATYADRPETGVTLRKAREQVERECIAAALAKHRGRMADAAQALGIQRTNLYRKMRQLRVPRAGKPTRG